MEILTMNKIDLVFKSFEKNYSKNAMKNFYEQYRSVLGKKLWQNIVFDIDIHALKKILHEIAMGKIPECLSFPPTHLEFQFLAEKFKPTTWHETKPPKPELTEEQKIHKKEVANHYLDECFKVLGKERVSNSQN